MALFIGTTLLLFEKLESTNSYAQHLLSKSGGNENGNGNGAVAEGTVVQAIEQTAGRGQFGTHWQSATGENLTFSLILRPNFLPIAEQFVLNQAVALAIHDFLKPYFLKSQTENAQTENAQVQNLQIQNLQTQNLHFSSPQMSANLRIKWSNDILINDKKICGILIENALQGTQLSTSIIGIGLNINQLNFVNLPQATSLRQETYLLQETAAPKNAAFQEIAVTQEVCLKKYDLNTLRQELFDCFEARYLQLRFGRKKQLQKDYLAALYRYGEDACYERTATNTIFWGRIIGISAEGRLEIAHQNGIEAFGFKEIRFL